MIKGFQRKMCPRCHFPQMKLWEELTDEEKFLVERLPLSASFTRQERKTHLFCLRCWHEEAEKTIENC
ncbi:MAG: hypothetical protein M3R14_01885 [Acidobacteriota bacterium]|nr:hypothetical protein [Acidobacteriota bacterium]